MAAYGDTASTPRKKKSQSDNRNSGGNPWSILSILQKTLGGSGRGSVKPVEYKRGGRVRRKSKGRGRSRRG